MLFELAAGLVPVRVQRTGNQRAGASPTANFFPQGACGSDGAGTESYDTRWPHRRLSDMAGKIAG